MSSATITTTIQRTGAADSTTVETRVLVHGWICGGAWWPVGALIGKPISGEVRPHDPESVPTRTFAFGAERPNLAAAVWSAIEQDACSDFSDAGRLTADSWIEFQRISISTRAGRTTRTVRSRSYDAEELPSLIELVAAETYSSDFTDEQED